MNFIIYTRYIKEKTIIPPFTLLFSLATFPLSRHSPPSHSSLVISPLFRHYIPPLLGRSLRIGEYVNGVRILFLSPRNPVFTIFCVAVPYYKSIIYIPFLYQSSIIRSSFLYPFYILPPPSS